MKRRSVSTLVLMSFLVIPHVFAQGNVSIDQAVSDEAQRKTIAFSGLAFLTGDMCSDTFFPPGKVSDFMGFQYMRDIASNGYGHNTMYAGNISDNVLGIIGQENVDALVDLANTQADQVHLYGYKRFVLIDAFRRVFNHDMPTGATGLIMNAVAEFSADLYEVDALISYQRAQVLSAILADLSTTQSTAITQLHADLEALFLSYNQGDDIPVHLWPTPAQTGDISGLNDPHDAILVSTYATQLYSWYLGSIYGDTYFCPERHGTYFGSFYMKDIPLLTASGPVSIDPNLTADMGQAFLDILDTTQSALVTGLVDIQRNNLYDIVTVREQIATELRQLMTDPTLDIWDEVRTLVRQYGNLDGQIVSNYATSFSGENDSLYGDQASQLLSLRTDYYALFPDYQADPTVYDCTTPWLYAEHLNEWPEITNSDFLFGVSQVTADGATLESLETGLSFAEGPTADSSGDIYFSDIGTGTIHIWSVDQAVVSNFMTGLSGPNGLFFDGPDLLVCEGGNGRLLSIDPLQNVTVLADTYAGQSFNEPNDLWIDAQGGVYFTDPVYFGSPSQDGEHVYYLNPTRDLVTRVISDLVRPNGIIGSEDGSTLYVSDEAADMTYSYGVNADGSLVSQGAFVAVGSDGMTIDNQGNIYLTDQDVLIYNTDGTLLETIDIPLGERPTNLSFGGGDLSTLFITTQNGLYSIEMSVSGVSGTGDIFFDGFESGDLSR